MASGVANRFPWESFMRQLANRNLKICESTLSCISYVEADVTYLVDTQKEVIETIFKMIFARSFYAPSKEDLMLFLEEGHRFLINIAAYDFGAEYLSTLLAKDEDALELLMIKCIKTPEDSKPFIQLLCNLTRTKDGRDVAGLAFLNRKEYITYTLSTAYRNTGSEVSPLLFNIISNMCIDPEFQKALLTFSINMLIEAISILKSSNIETEREPVLAILKNLSMSLANHNILLGKVKALSYVLYPLLGPEYVITEEEMRELPTDLQYLTHYKDRTTAHGQKMILETLLQFCSTKETRKFLRKHGTYYILREYHKWNKNTRLNNLCEQVVNLLIRTEAEIAVDNLRELPIPEAQASRFPPNDYTF